jgi:uncharacterized membrane protein YuzA (DUF378 family)
MSVRLRVVGFALVAWFVSLAALLITFGGFTAELYLSIGLAGLFLVAEYTDRKGVVEPWRTRFTYVLVGLGLLYVGYVLFRVAQLVGRSPS